MSRISAYWRNWKYRRQMRGTFNTPLGLSVAFALYSGTFLLVVIGAVVISAATYVLYGLFSWVLK